MDDKKYCLPLTMRSRGLKITPTYRIPQLENFAGIQTNRKPNFDPKISIAARLMARSNNLTN